MADSYGVSQASIREALNRIKVLDVIQVKHGHGSFINHRMPLGYEQNFEIITKADIANLLDLRKIIEVGCARSACEQADQNDVKKGVRTIGKRWRMHCRKCGRQWSIMNSVSRRIMLSI